MNSTLVVSLVLMLWVTYIFCLPFAGSCDSCGRECQSACGTRGFRTCCLNYLKKRSTPLLQPATETGMNNKHQSKMELIMVLPELAEYYPSLGYLLSSDLSNQNHMKKLFEKQQIERTEESEPE